jgi:hypothetical protein
MFPDSILPNVVDVYFKFAQNEIDYLRYLKNIEFEERGISDVM